MGAPQLQSVHGLQERQRVVYRKFAVFHLTHKPVRPQDTNHRLVDDGAAIDGGNYVVFAVQTTDEWNHRFSGRFPFGPVGQVLVDLFVTHA